MIRSSKNWRAVGFVRTAPHESRSLPARLPARQERGSTQASTTPAWPCLGVQRQEGRRPCAGPARFAQAKRRRTNQPSRRRCRGCAAGRGETVAASRLPWTRNQRERIARVFKVGVCDGPPSPLAAVLGNSHVLGAALQLLCVCARASQKTCAVPRSTGLSTRTVCPSPTTKRLPSPSALPAAPGRSCVLVLTPPCAPVQTLLRATHLSVRCSAATQRNTARSVHCNRASGRERRCGGLQRHGHVLRAGEPRVCVLWTPWTPVHSCITPGAFNRLAPAKPSPCLVLGRSGTWIRKKPPLPLTTGAHHPEWAGGSMPARC